MADEMRVESRTSDGMPVAPKYFARSTKRIACLEGDWDGWRDDSSVRPLLQVLEERTNCKHYYRRCNTRAEFEYCLTKLAKAPGYHRPGDGFQQKKDVTRFANDLSVSHSQLIERLGFVMHPSPERL